MVKSTRFDVWRVGCATRENGHFSELTRLRDRVPILLIKFAKASVNKEPDRKISRHLAASKGSICEQIGRKPSVHRPWNCGMCFQACASHSCQVDQRATMVEIHRRSIGEVVWSNAFTGLVCAAVPPSMRPSPLPPGEGSVSCELGGVLHSLSTVCHGLAEISPCPDSKWISGC
jgi:hypothetical protein